MDNVSTGNSSVDKMQDFIFPRDVLVIPKAWQYTVVNEKGKPNRLAMEMLAQIVYWYRPSGGEGRNPKGRKRFWGGKFQKSVSDWMLEFNEKDKTIRRALSFLEKDLGVIKKSTDNIRTTKGKVCNNVLYVELNVDRLYELTFPDRYTSQISERTNLTNRAI